MKFTICPIRPRDIEAARRLLADNGWDSRVADPERFRRLVELSSRALVALDGESVVGFARALTDGMANGYISLVCVAATHRRQGVGRELVQTLMGADEAITWVLRAARPDVAGFYAKLGFAPSTVTMERVGRRPG